MYQYGWFSPNGENVNFGILPKLTFHSLMKEKPLGNKVNKCRVIFGPLWVIFGPFLGHFVAFLKKFAESSNFFAG